MSITAQEFFNNFLIMISLLGSNFGVIALVSVLFVRALLIKKEFTRALLILLSLGSYPASLLLKLIFKESRPEGAVVVEYFAADRYGFPSSHVMFYTVFWGYLFLISDKIFPKDKILRRSLQSLSILLIFLVAVSRIYLGVHSFVDVLGGYAFGAVYLLGIELIERKFVQKNNKKDK